MHQNQFSPTCGVSEIGLALGEANFQQNEMEPNWFYQIKFY
jgi:hypothetical protein